MFGMNKRMRLTAAGALFAGAAMGLAQPAQAFEPSNCSDISSDAVSEFNVLKVDGGGADFGDDLHLLGAPQGNAIICWFSHGRAGIVGKVYADSFSGEPLVATAQIRYRRTNGSTVTRTFGIGTNISWVASGLVRDLSPTGSFNNIRIRLFTSKPLQPTLPSKQVSSRTFNR